MDTNSASELSSSKNSVVKNKHDLKPFVGSSVKRVESHMKVQGAALYVDDIELPGMIYGTTIRSSVARGRVQKITFEGDVPWSEFTVVTAQDIKHKNIVKLILEDQPFLADEWIQHPDEPVVLIAHPDKYLLQYAKQFVQIHVDEQPYITTIEESDQKNQVIWGEDNIQKKISIHKGDPDSVWAKADYIVEGEYKTGSQEQLYIETNGMIADVQNGVVTVHGSMQCPYYVSAALQSLFNLSEKQVRVIQTETGGGFGGKEEYPSILAGHAALLSEKAQAPVKIIYDRHEDIAATTKRHPSRTRIRTALSKEGKFLAHDIEFLLDGGAYATLSAVVLSRGAIHACGPYSCPNVRLQAKALATNTPPRGAFRGFGAPQSCFAMERHIDRIAKKLKKRPDEIRRLNFLNSGDTTATGQHIKDGIHISEVMETTLKVVDYQKKYDLFSKENQSSSPIKRGIGFATFFHGAGFTGSGEKYLSSQVKVIFEKDKIVVLTSNTEIGQGTYTIFSQIAGDSLSIPLDRIEVMKPDTFVVPNSGPTVASRTVMVVGKLVEQACQDLLSKLQNQTQLKKHYTSREFFDACILYQEKLGSLIGQSQYQQAPHIQWDDQLYVGDAYPTYAWGCYVAEVQVDLRSYETKVIKFTAAQEVGKVVNPILAQGQIEGGVLQGVGFAIYEKVIESKGSVKNSNLTNYIIPTAVDAPDIQVRFMETNSPFGPSGAKGIGELPLDGSAPAVINAIAHALGNDPCHIPFLPEDLLSSISK